MATEAQAIAGDWGGGVHPYRVGHRKLGMWLFIMSDSLTFSALLIAYAYVRASNVWPTPFRFYPSIVFSSVMTLVLLSSSLTMVMAVSASARKNKSAARKWILATAVLGATFIVLHMIEWRHLINDFHLTLTTNLFGTTFYSLVGLHASHVVIGLTMLTIALVLGLRGSMNGQARRFELLSWYWHFVDAVWVAVFTVVYVIGR